MGSAVRAELADDAVVEILALVALERAPGDLEALFGHADHEQRVAPGGVLALATEALGLHADLALGLVANLLAVAAALELHGLSPRVVDLRGPVGIGGPTLSRGPAPGRAGVECSSDPRDPGGRDRGNRNPHGARRRARLGHRPAQGGRRLLLGHHHRRPHRGLRRCRCVRRHRGGRGRGRRPRPGVHRGRRRHHAHLGRPALHRRRQQAPEGPRLRRLARGDAQVPAGALWPQRRRGEVPLLLRAQPRPLRLDGGPRRALRDLLLPGGPGHDSPRHRGAHVHGLGAGLPLPGDREARAARAHRPAPGQQRRPRAHDQAARGRREGRGEGLLQDLHRARDHERGGGAWWAPSPAWTAWRRTSARAAACCSPPAASSTTRTWWADTRRAWRRSSRRWATTPRTARASASASGPGGPPSA